MSTQAAFDHGPVERAVATTERAMIELKKLTPPQGLADQHARLIEALASYANQCRALADGDATADHDASRANVTAAGSQVRAASDAVYDALA